MPLSIGCFSMLRCPVTIITISNGIGFYTWLFSQPQASVKSLSKESCTCTLGAAQLATIWPLSDPSLVTYVRQWLPTRQVYLSWVQVSQPLVQCWISQMSAQLLDMSAASTVSCHGCQTLLASASTTVDHLALWYLPSLSRNCYKEHMRFKTIN